MHLQIQWDLAAIIPRLYLANMEKKTMTKEQNQEHIKIEEIVPHRYPFLMIDKILERTPGKSATCIKNVSVNEPYFQGHFPEYPIMPGVMICEAMAQTAGIATGMTHGMKDIGILAEMEKVKFNKPVFPGDTLVIKAKIDGIKMNVIKATVKAFVGDHLVASAKYTIVIISDILTQKDTP